MVLSRQDVFPDVLAVDKLILDSTSCPAVVLAVDEDNRFRGILGRCHHSVVQIAAEAERVETRIRQIAQIVAFGYPEIVEKRCIFGRRGYLIEPVVVVSQLAFRLIVVRSVRAFVRSEPPVFLADTERDIRLAR